jgi:DNA replication protein DnaC
LRRNPVLTHPTLDQLRQLGLAGMARAYEELTTNPRGGELDHAEWLGLLLDRELADRQDRRLKARLRYARLRQQATIEDVVCRTPRGLDRALLQKLALGGWIETKQNLIIEGPTGVGKSWLACALGHKACRDNHSVLYQRVPRLFADLALAHGDGRYARLMRALGGVKLLILDDWGREPLGPEQRRDLLEIAEERPGRGATLITSQIPVDRWHDLIGDPTLADAILDRIVHNAHRIPPKKEGSGERHGLTELSHRWRDPPCPRITPPRPTSIGMAGRLQSEQVADITSECLADFVGIRSPPTCAGRLEAPGGIRFYAIPATQYDF